MTIRIAAIEVGHWHSQFNAAYLRTLAKTPEVRLVSVQDTGPEDCHRAMRVVDRACRRCCR